MVSGLYPQGRVALSDGATISVNAALGDVFDVTLGGNRTMAAPTNLTDGQTLIFRIKQDATGSRTITWNAIYDWGDNGAPTLTTTANKIDVVGGKYHAASNKIHMFPPATGFV